MKRITALADAPAMLETYWPNPAAKHRMSLDYMRELMDYLGNPQDTYKVIHIAGTSGKTSTAYYVAALLHVAGRNVGLTVSPHVDTLNERVQINMTPMPEALFITEMNEFMALIEHSGLRPAYFELLCAFAFWEFARQRVEYAVVEVGIGGTLDNTNVMTRRDKISILTDIGYDHMGVLGHTLPEIAAQKAGIILPNNAVFCWRQPAEVLQVFKDAARHKQADLHVLDRPQLGARYDFLPLFQRRNFELAREAVRYVLARDSCSPLTAAAAQAAAHTVIPARMEVRHYHGKTVILDGSHNPQKLHALAESVREAFPDTPIAVLVGFAHSSTPQLRTDTGTQELLSIAAHIIGTSFMVNRAEQHPSADPAAIAATCKAAGFTSCEIVSDAETAFKTLLARPEPVVLVAGSFYLLNVIRPLLGEASVGRVE